MNIISYGTLTNHVHKAHFQLTYDHFQKKRHIVQPTAMEEEIFIFLLLLLLVPMGLFSVWGKNFHNLYFRYSSISGVHKMCFELSLLIQSWLEVPFHLWQQFTSFNFAYCILTRELNSCSQALWSVLHLTIAVNAWWVPWAGSLAHSWKTIAFFYCSHSY
jgi:hypothetical protein